MKEVSRMRDGTRGAGILETSGVEGSEPRGAVRAPDAPDPEAGEKPGRRKFSGQYRLQVLLAVS